MLVKNKGRDIAILRTMGASQGAILRIFFMCGALIGASATLAGLVLGSLFCIFIGPIQTAVESLTGVSVLRPLDLLSVAPAGSDRVGRGRGGRGHRLDHELHRHPCRRPGARRASIRSRPYAMSKDATLSRSQARAAAGLASNDPNTPVLSLRGVARSYQTGGGRTLEVLKGVDLDVRPGEIVGLIGPSGSGKSSLLHAAGLLEHPTAGQVAVAGRRLHALERPRPKRLALTQHRLRLSVPPPAGRIHRFGQRGPAPDDRRRAPAKGAGAG